MKPVWAKSIKFDILKIKILRERCNFTQEDVSKFLGISRSAYAMREIGQRPFTLIEGKKLALLYSVTLDELFFEALCHEVG